MELVAWSRSNPPSSQLNKASLSGRCPLTAGMATFHERWSAGRLLRVYAVCLGAPMTRGAPRLRSARGSGPASNNAHDQFSPARSPFCPPRRVLDESLAVDPGRPNLIVPPTSGHFLTTTSRGVTTEIGILSHVPAVSAPTLTAVDPRHQSPSTRDYMYNGSTSSANRRVVTSAPMIVRKPNTTSFDRSSPGRARLTSS